MNLLDVFRLILGVILLFFLPGFIVIRLYYRKIQGFERALLIAAISIAIGVFIALLLGLIGIFNYINSLIGYAIVLLAIVAPHVIRNKLYE